ncbi:MAG: pentapeptide repeat-containing protein [Hyphomicrobiales bacterium]|nr:pentapeptide repeat-containing protein [Hyphomicrobiales bacterium]
MRKERSKALRWKRRIIARGEEPIRFWKKLTSWIDERVTSWWGEQTFGKRVITCVFVVLITVLCALSFKFEHATRNLILLTAGLIGWYFLFKRTRVAEQSLTVDQLTHAINQLTNENLAVRLGGILGLEQIAETQEEERKKIARILVTFIRTHATKDSEEVKKNLATYKSPNFETEEEFDAYRTLRLDIEAAVNALASIASKLEKQEQFGKQHNETKHDLCDLQNTDLRGLRFVKANLSRFNLIGADMSGAWLAGAKLMDAYLYNPKNRSIFLFGDRKKDSGTKFINAFLDGANLSGAYLNFVDFSGAQIVQSDLSKARLNKSIFVKTNLESTNLNGASLRAAVFQKSNLKSANLSNANLTLAKFEHTRLKNTIFNGTQINSATFENCEGLTQKQVDKMLYREPRTSLGHGITTLPEGLRLPKPEKKPIK